MFSFWDNKKNIENIFDLYFTFILKNMKKIIINSYNNISF